MASAGLGTLPPPVMPGSDAAVGKAPDTQLLAASVSFGVGQAESAHLTESGEPVGHAEFHHLPVDGLHKPALVEDADDASKLVCWVPNLAVESFAFSDAFESLGCLTAKGLVVLRRVDCVEPDFDGLTVAAKPAEARRYATVAVVNADDSYGEGFVAAEVQAATPALGFGTVLMAGPIRNSSRLRIRRESLQVPENIEGFGFSILPANTLHIVY